MLTSLLRTLPSKFPKATLQVGSMYSPAPPSRYDCDYDVEKGLDGGPLAPLSCPLRLNVMSALSKFPKTTLQYEGDDDVDAMLIFLETRKYGQSWNVHGSF